MPRFPRARSRYRLNWLVWGGLFVLLTYFILHLRICLLILEREEGGGGGGGQRKTDVREKHQSVAFHTPPTRD